MSNSASHPDLTAVAAAMAAGESPGGAAEANGSFLPSLQSGVPSRIPSSQLLGQLAGQGQFDQAPLGGYGSDAR